MFLTLITLTVFSSTYGLHEQSINSIDALNQAAIDVISLHKNNDYDYSDEWNPSGTLSRNKRSNAAFINIPHLEESNFMHGYIAGSGAGNREDIFIERIQEEELKVNVVSMISGWNYIRYNSSDYVMAVQEHNIDVWRMRLSRDAQQFTFDHRFTYCDIDIRSEGRIMHAMFFTKLIKHVEILFFAITIDSPKGYQLRAYQVNYGECVSLLQINLRNKRPLGISFVKSQYESALVVLYQSNHQMVQLNYVRKGYNENHKIIEVYVNNPIDMETFTINGFGYIAVAHQFGCDVFRLSEFIEHHFLFDSIRIQGIVDIKAFRLAFDYFLGLATNGNNQHLYVWHGGSFYPKQVLNVADVIQWNTIYMPTCRDDVIVYLVRRNPHSPAHIYLWHGQTRQFQLAVDDINKMMPYQYDVLPFSQTDFSYNHTAYILQVDTKRKPHLISIHTTLSPVPDPVLLRGKTIINIMSKLKDRFVFHQLFLKNISESIKFAVRSKTTNFLPGNQLFKSLKVLKGIVSARVNNLMNIIWQNSPLTVNDLKYRINDIIQDVNKITAQLNHVDGILNDAVFRNEPALITGHKQFIGNNELSSLNGSSLLINSVGQINVHSVFSNLYRMSRPSMTIKGLKHFIRPIYIKGSINNDFINGINLVRQVMISNVPQLITGSVEYFTPLTIINELSIAGKLNDIDLSNDIVMINNSEVIHSSKIFISPLINAYGVTTLLLDGIDLTHLVANSLFTSGTQSVSSKKMFINPLTTGIIGVDGQVNGIDISAMVPNLVCRNRPAFIKGRKTFILDDVYIKNNLIINNFLDGKRIPDDLFLPGVRQLITGFKHFMGNTRFDEELIVGGLVDGFRLPDDIITISGNETISGPLIFPNGVIVNQNIDAKKLVDGVDLSELNLHVLKLTDQRIGGDVRFRQLVKVKDIEVQKNVNGINLNLIINEAVFKGSSSVEIQGSKHFSAGLDVEELYVEMLNGVNISDFVSTIKNETIFSSKIFSGFASFNPIMVSGLVDNVNIERLFNNRISLTQNEIIFGPRNFLNEMNIINTFNSEKTINGIVLQKDVVLKSTPQVINGLKIFNKRLTAHDVMAKTSVSVRGKVDNVLINDIASRRVQLDANKIFPSPVVLIDSSSKIIHAQNVNGINISNFADNIMSISKPQVVAAPKTLKNIQHFSKILSNKGVNGIWLPELNENAVHLHHSNLILAPFTFSHPVEFRRPLVIMGVINGVNISYVAYDSVYKIGPQLISGHNVFKSGFSVNGNINTNHVNSIDLSREVLTKFRDHTFRGSVIFAKPLNVSSNILVSGLVGGIDLSEFDARVMKTNRQNVITGNLEIVGQSKIDNDLTIRGRINGVNLNAIFNDALFLNGNQEIDGAKAIHAPLQFVNNLNSELINGINIADAIKDIVFAESPLEQYINSNKKFVNEVLAAGGIMQTNGVADLGPINDVHLLDLNLETIRINLPNTLYGIRHFKNTVIINNNRTQVDGKINGIDLNRDVVLLHRNPSGDPQKLFGHRTFEDILLLNNALVNGLVNGLPLQSFVADTMFVGGEQNVEAHKIIKGHLQLSSGDIIVDSLNGNAVQQEFVTLNDDHIIFSDLSFNNTLRVNENLKVNGLIAGINLTKLVEESMYKDVPQLVSARISFNSIIFREDVRVDEHVDNVDLSAFSNSVKQFMNAFNTTKHIMLASANRHSYVSNYLFNTLEKSTNNLQGFTLYQVLEGAYGGFIDVYGEGMFSINELNGNTVSLHSIRYNAKNELFETSMITPKSHFIRTKFIKLRNTEFVIQMSSMQSNVSSQVTEAGKVVAFLGLSLYQVESLVLSDNNALVATLQYDGQFNLYTISRSQSNPAASMNHVGSLNVGKDASKIALFEINNQVYIVVARNHRSSCMTDNSASIILEWHQNDNSFNLVQTIPLLNVVDVVHYKYHAKDYLILSDATPAYASLEAQSIFVYRSVHNKNRCYFSLFQKLAFENTIQLVAFSLGTVHLQQYFIAAANTTHINIWQQEGESGFIRSWSLYSGNVQTIRPIAVDDHLFIIVAQSNRCHESLVFKAEMNRLTLTNLIFNDEQN